MLRWVQTKVTALRHAAVGVKTKKRLCGCVLPSEGDRLRCCLLRRVQVKEAALLLAAVGANKVRAASCCGGYGRRWLRCCLLRWVHAKKAALLFAAVDTGAGGWLLLAAVCCGGCMRRRLRCCLLQWIWT